VRSIRLIADPTRALQLSLGVDATHAIMIRLALPVEDGDLRIRSWLTADVEDYFALRRDPDVARYVGDPPEEMYRAESWLATDIRLAAAGTCARVAIEEGRARIIGLLSLQHIRGNDDSRWELVIGIARPHRGMHRGSRAVTLLLDAVFASNSDIDAVYGRREFGNKESSDCAGLRPALLLDFLAA
jgi:RimJ/RimL family protein N-acetyltransferase